MNHLSLGLLVLILVVVLVRISVLVVGGFLYIRRGGRTVGA